MNDELLNSLSKFGVSIKTEKDKDSNQNEDKKIKTSDKVIFDPMSLTVNQILGVEE